MNDKRSTNNGHCLCGEVKFTITDCLRNIMVCHCNQCHQWHGQAGFYCQSKMSSISFLSRKTLKWYRSSAQAERGFCSNCGSSLFWKPSHTDRISIAAGSLSKNNELSVIAHIYCDSRPSYDSIEEQLPCYPGTAAGELDPL